MVTHQSVAKLPPSDVEARVRRGGGGEVVAEEGFSGGGGEGVEAGGVQIGGGWWRRGIRGLIRMRFDQNEV